MNESANNRDLCLGCGRGIDNALLVDRCGPFAHTVRQTHCGECGFLAYFRAQALVHRRPYKRPVERPTPDGRAPASYLAQLEAHKAHMEPATREEGQ